MNVIRTKQAFLLFTFFVFYSSIHAQDCSLSVNKNALKHYKKAMSLKDDDNKVVAKKINCLKEAIKIDPHFYKAIWQLTSTQMKHPYVSEITIREVKENLTFIVNDCPELHSSPYYFLGDIYMGENNLKKAKEFYQAFVNYSSSNPNGYDKENYNTYLDKAKEQLSLISRKQRIKEVKRIEESSSNASSDVQSGFHIERSKVIEEKSNGAKMVLIVGKIDQGLLGQSTNTQISIAEEKEEKRLADVDQSDGHFNALVEIKKNSKLEFTIRKSGMTVASYMVSGITSELVIKEIGKFDLSEN